jgi:hypothetical protein
MPIRQTSALVIRWRLFIFNEVEQPTDGVFISLKMKRCRRITNGRGKIAARRRGGMRTSCSRGDMD